MTLTPPLLVAMAGRKPRLRKAKLSHPKEYRLQIAIADLLRIAIRPGWRWTHIAHGGFELPPRVASRLKAMGLQPGWLDFIFISPAKAVYFLEMKRKGGKLSDDQKEFCAWCDDCRVPYGVADNIDDAVMFLKNNNIIKPFVV
jgi:hypothetical protein